MLNNQKLTANRETVIKTAAMVAVAALMFGLILVFNSMIGYAADDYLYFFKYTGHVVKGTPERLTGIGDIFTGMVTHYKICNGRIPAHFLLQLFTFFDKSVFNIFNSLFFVLLGLLIYFHANYKRPINIPLLIFIYINTEKSQNPSAAKETIFSVLMLLAGILAGWTNENMGGAAIGAVILFLIYFKIKKMPVRAHHITGFIGTVIGFGILILAPGNRVRFDHTKRERNILKHLKWSFDQLTWNIWRALLVMLIVFVIVLLIWRIKKLKIDWLRPCIYALTGFAGAGVMLLSPEAPPRSFFGANVMFACAAFSLAAQVMDKQLSGVKRTAIVISALLAIGFGTLYVGEYYALKSDSLAYAEIKQEIYDQKAAGIKDIKIPVARPRRSMWSLYSYMASLPNNKSNSRWLDDWAAEYYGVDSITMIKKPKNR